MNWRMDIIHNKIIFMARYCNGTYLMFYGLIYNGTGNQCCGTVSIYYGSGSDFWQVTVPVTALAPYLDHKSSFARKKIDELIQIYCKMWMKNILKEGSQTHNCIPYCVCENFCNSILFRNRNRFRWDKKLQFLRFRFRHTAGNGTHRTVPCGIIR